MNKWKKHPWKLSAYLKVIKSAINAENDQGGSVSEIVPIHEPYDGYGYYDYARYLTDHSEEQS